MTKNFFCEFYMQNLKNKNITTTIKCNKVQIEREKYIEKYKKNKIFTKILRLRRKKLRRKTRNLIALPRYLKQNKKFDGYIKSRLKKEYTNLNQINRERFAI